MIVYTPNREDAFHLLEQPSWRGLAAAKAALHLGIGGTLAAVAVGAILGVVLAEPLDVAAPLSALGFAALLVLAWAQLARATNLLEWWRASRIRRYANDYPLSSTTTIWPDQAGVNVTREGQHAHIAWTNIKSTGDVGELVVLISTAGQVLLDIPKRVGHPLSEFKWVVASVKASGDAAITGLPASQRPAPGDRPVFRFPLNELDLAAAFIDRWRGSEFLPLRDARRLGAGRAALIATAAAFVLLRATGIDAPTVLLAGCGLALLAGAVVGWFAAASAYWRRLRQGLKAKARRRISRFGGEVHLWLQPEGLGCIEPTAARLISWASLRLHETDTLSDSRRAGLLDGDSAEGWPTRR